MSTINARGAQGFTLLELLIAIAIFALLALATYQMLDTVLSVDRRTREHDQQLRELTRAMAAFERDIRQLQIRPIRDQFGDRQPALGNDLYDASALELSRGGWRNPQGQSRAEVQRVRWQLVDDTWQRRYWQVLDRAQDSQPVVQTALTGVRSVRLRYLDEQGQWQVDWPPPEQAGDRLLTGMPLAIELDLEHQQHGQIRRLYRVLEAPSRQAPQPPAEVGL